MTEHTNGIPVMINLASLASYDGIADDPIRLITTGTLFTRGSLAELKYHETQEDENTGELIESDIQLLLKKDRVTMNRTGAYSNTMLFERNRRYETTFHTPFGDLPMAVTPSDVLCTLQGDNGTVHLKYELSMQGAYASTNELHLEYRAKH